MISPLFSDELHDKIKKLDTELMDCHSFIGVHMVDNARLVIERQVVEFMTVI